MSNDPKLRLTEQQRAELKIEFGKLGTIDEKLDFWSEKLRVDFCHFDNYSMDDIQDFWIYTENKDEIEYINTRNLNVYKDKARVIYSKNRFLDFEERTETFRQNIEKASNKDLFIDEEIRKLDLLISQKEQENNPSTLFKTRFFVNIYRQFIESGIIQTWDNHIQEVGNLVEADQGLTVAKYKLFLEEYRMPKKPEPKKTLAFSHDQQIFILDYLGLYKDLDNVKRAKLYAPIINRDWETTRQRFSSLETRKTVENLNPILSYFTELGFEQQVQLVRKDIDRKEEERKSKKNKKQ